MWMVQNIIWFYGEELLAPLPTLKLEDHSLLTELPEDWMESIFVLIHMKGDKKTVEIIEAYHFCQLHSKFYPKSCCEV
jgi:hypothetical protein